MRPILKFGQKVHHLAGHHAVQPTVLRVVRRGLEADAVGDHAAELEKALSRLVGARDAEGSLALVRRKIGWLAAVDIIAHTRALLCAVLRSCRLSEQPWGCFHIWFSNLNHACFLVYQCKPKVQTKRAQTAVLRQPVLEHVVHSLNGPVGVPLLNGVVQPLLQAQDIRPAHRCAVHPLQQLQSKALV